MTPFSGVSVVKSSLEYTFAMNLRIGTSGWSYASWKPAFFPDKLPSKRFLEFYSTQLNAVELNGTFRRMPTASAIAGWVNATPPDFRFLLQSLEPMRQSGKLGPVLFQLPPNLKADTGLLETFVQALPTAYQFAFEFRHESWFSDSIYEILRKKNVALCWAESEKIMTPKVAIANFVYYRFREPEYSSPDLQKVAEELKTQSADREVYAFFKHEEQPESALNAVTAARLNGIEAKPFVMPEKKTGKKKG